MERGHETKNKFLRHHTAGLGDGKFHDTDERKSQDLALPQLVLGAQGKNRYVRTREGKRQISSFDPPDVLDNAISDAAAVPYAPGVQQEDRLLGRYGDYSLGAAAVADDGPWQLSIVSLFGIIAMLVLLFLHMVSDPQAQNAGGGARPHYGHQHTRRTRRQARSASLHTKKKKTDEWSEDEVVSDVDGSYQADNEKNFAGGGFSALHVAQVPLYYPHDYKPQQKHRQRKLATTTKSTKNGNVSLVSPIVGPKVTHPSDPTFNVIDSQPYYHHQNSRGGAGIYATSSQEFSPEGTVLRKIAAKELQSMAVTSRPNEAKEELFGTGLEGFNFSPRDAVDNGTFCTKLSKPKHLREKGERTTEAPSTKARNINDRGVTMGQLGDCVIEASGTGLQRKSTTSPFQSFDSLLLDVSQEVSLSKVVPSVSHNATDIGSGVMGMSNKDECFDFAPTSSKETFEVDYSPYRLRNRRTGEERMRSSVVVQSGSYDHDFTPRADNFKKRLIFPIGREKSHESDVESAFGDEFHPLPLYSSPEEQKNILPPTADEIPAKINEVNQLCFGSQIQKDQHRKLSSGQPFKGDNSVVFGGVKLPFIPDLSRENKTISANLMYSQHLPSFEDVVRPPRSVTMEELHLIKMESGDINGHGKWKADSEPEPNIFADTSNAHQLVETAPKLPRPHQSKLQMSFQTVQDGQRSKVRNRNTAGGNESQRQLMEEIAAQESSLAARTNHSGEPATPIQHKRPDVTKWSDASASLTLPIDFSELELKNVIGGGGFGQVWKATWRGTPVAVKVLSNPAQTEHVSKSFLEEFASEINMVSGMRHPNICLYMGACLVPPNRAIVTEFAAHGSLWDALRSPLDPPYTASDGATRKGWPLSLFQSPASNPPEVNGHGWYKDSSELMPSLPPVGAWPWVLIKHVAVGAARGMTYLHGGKPPVLHRDLKSANLLLDDSYTTKVADFGLSRIKAQERSMTGNCGTVQWMAPEILSNESYAEPADVYSFGIILWEMLSRECPFEGMSPIQCALAVLNKNAQPEIPPWCPQVLASLIERCIERNPLARPTFSQILAELDSIG